MPQARYMTHAMHGELAIPLALRVERQQKLVPSSIGIHGMILVYYFQSIVHFLVTVHCELSLGARASVFSLLDEEG